MTVPQASDLKTAMHCAPVCAPDRAFYIFERQSTQQVATGYAKAFTRPLPEMEKERKEMKDSLELLDRLVSSRHSLRNPSISNV